jgi:hypothetical protein
MATTKITSNVIADDAITSDQLGGDLTMPGHVSLADNKEIRVGTGNDLVIKHSGSHTTLTNTTGNLTLAGDAVYIANAANSEYLAQFIANGAASLRYNDTEELATVSGGVYVPNKLGIGTNSASSELHVKGSGEVQVYIDAATNNNSGVRFLENGANKWTIGNDNTNDGFFFYDFGASAERMRIKADGNVTINEALLVGTDAAYDKLAVLRTSTSQTAGMTLINDQAGGYGSGITWESKRSDANNIQTAARLYVAGANSWNSDSTASSQFIFFLRSSNTLTERLRINHDGTFTGSGSNDISDQRLKENIKTIPNALTTIKGLTGRTFTWKEKAKQPPGTKYGFLAQEVQSVVSDLVNNQVGLLKIKEDESVIYEDLDAAKEGEWAKSVQTTGIIPILVEAMKEQQTLIETLQTKVAALESK